MRRAEVLNRPWECDAFCLGGVHFTEHLKAATYHGRKPQQHFQPGDSMPWTVHRLMGLLEFKKSKACTAAMPLTHGWEGGECFLDHVILQMRRHVVGDSRLSESTSILGIPCS